MKFQTRRNFFIFYCILLFLLIQFSFSSPSYAASSKLINTLTKAFEQIQDWIIKLATPAAAIAVGSGVFMKKFSFGDEEKIRTGKKIIKGSLFSYAFILAIDLILSTIKSFI